MKSATWKVILQVISKQKLPIGAQLATFPQQSIIHAIRTWFLGVTKSLEIMALLQENIPHYHLITRFTFQLISGS